MSEINFSPTKKQHQCWKLLQDDHTIHVLYGGSAGSGKSYLACIWLLINCLQYPGTRYLMGRARLNNIKKTTLKTFFDICKIFKFKQFTYNQQNNTIFFDNGSEIILFDLYNYPSDPDYDRLGSLEITGAIIDELSEISYKGFQVLTSRIRYKLNEFNLTPKLFCCSNPYQGWTKNYFYIPFRENKETNSVKFIQALPTDNPYLPKSYIETLETTLDNALKQRLLFGNWDFDSSDYDLFEYEKLQQSFYNDFIENSNDKMYITADIGDLGSDKTIICVWKGWNCIKRVKLSKKETTEVVNEIRTLQSEWKVMISNIIVDATGVGAGVASLLKGCIRYMAGSKALNNEGYRNVKSQLMYKFAEKINKLEVNFNFDYDDDIIQECLLCKKEFNNMTAGITTKENMKNRLGRSPDNLDSLYLRAYFEFKSGQSVVRIINR